MIHDHKARIGCAPDDKMLFKRRLAPCYSGRFAYLRGSLVIEVHTAQAAQLISTVAFERRSLGHRCNSLRNTLY